METDILLIISITLLILVIFGIYLFRRRRPKIGPRETIPLEKKAAAPSETPSPPLSPNPWQQALQKSREPLLARWKGAIQELASGASWNASHPVWEALEETLLGADIGPRLTEDLLDSLKRDFRERPEPEALKNRLRERMLEILEHVPQPELREGRPRVTLLIGVNGAGKTTTAGKLASQAKSAGKKVVLGAGDTFRAAAVEQLEAWAKRIGVECVKPAQGSNPAAVAFDAAAAALARDADELIIDTAGRLHTKENLMEELKKLARVVDKKIPGAPHQVLLVLDATLGQNALQQAKEFSAAVKPTGLVLTKLDGSAKGGAAFAASADLALPVAFVGVGERAEDLRPFSAKEFVDHLLP